MDPPAGLPLEVAHGQDTSPACGFRRELGLLDTTVVVAGAIVGVGIFVNTANVARIVASPRLVLLVWLFGGVAACLGSFVYAELGSRLPVVGGQYVYLARAWHPLVGFLYGVAMLFIINGGAIAAVAMVLAQHVDDHFWRIGRGGALGLGAAVILALTAINALGVRPGARTNNWLMGAKALGIAALLAAGVLFHPPAANHLLTTTATLTGFPLASALFAGLVPVMFSYGGWQNCGSIAAEIRDPARTLAIGNVLGVAAVLVTYLSLNFLYLWVLPFDRIAASPAVAADAARVLIGEAGSALLATLVVISCLGFLAVIIMTGPRLYYAMAVDGIFFRRAGRLSPRYRTPTFTLWFQAAVSLVLLFTNTYDTLLSYVVFADWLFFGLAAAGVFTLRHRGVGESHAFRMPGWPVTPVLFLLIAIGIVANSFVVSPIPSLIGCAILAAGAVVYLVAFGLGRGESRP